jgi:hypothetical protein
VVLNFHPIFIPLNQLFGENFRFRILNCGFIVSLCSIIFYQIDPPASGSPKSSERGGPLIQILKSNIYEERGLEVCMSNLFWWLRQIVLISISAFFLYFGIRLLISAYEFNDPFTFLMTFFASNFIILISGTLIIGFVYRMITVYRLSKNSDS